MSMVGTGWLERDEAGAGEWLVCSMDLGGDGEVVREQVLGYSWACSLGGKEWSRGAVMRGAGGGGHKGSRRQILGAS